MVLNGGNSGLCNGRENELLYYLGSIRLPGALGRMVGSEHETPSGLFRA